MKGLPVPEEDKVKKILKHIEEIKILVRSLEGSDSDVILKFDFNVEFRGRKQ